MKDPQKNRKKRKGTKIQKVNWDFSYGTPPTMRSLGDTGHSNSKDMGDY
jgi:hypothetical protein